MNTILIHPTGNANVRHALLALEEGGSLEQFITSVAVYSGSIWDKLSRSRFGTELNRRRYTEPLATKTLQHPAREIARLLCSKAGLGRLTRHEEGVFCIDRVYQSIDGKAADYITRQNRKITKIVYAYEDGALKSFSEARAKDYHRIYDLPIGYWRAAQRIQKEEAELNPSWSMTMPALRDGQRKLDRKDKELELANNIIVASSFTANTLTEAPFDLPNPVVIPYGCPPINPTLSCKEKDSRMRRSDTRLRVLFVGGLSQRKGLTYLFDAISQLGEKACSLTVIGQRPSLECSELNKELNKHRWINSMPHQGILEAMRQHDVLVFPSLFEGFGLVITEALSQGIPVITTQHTCGPDVLDEGLDGFIIPIRSSDSIAEKLELLHSEPERLETMKLAAKEKAKKLTWETYRKKLLTTVRAIQ